MKVSNGLRIHIGWRFDQLEVDSTIDNCFFHYRTKCMAATKTVKEFIQLKGLLGDLEVIQENNDVFCDNRTATFLLKNQTFLARTKHIDMKYLYVREIIESCVVLLKKIDTKDNLSDILTKVISGIKF